MLSFNMILRLVYLLKILKIKFMPQMKLTFILDDALEIYVSACRAFISTFHYGSDESDLESDSSDPVTWTLIYQI